MSTEQDDIAAHEQDEALDGFSITDVLVLLGQEKKRLFAITAIGTAFSLGVALLVPRYYVARTLLLPPQQSSAAANALAQLGAMGSMASIATGVKTPEEMYVALLKSRSVQDEVIKKFDLQKRYELNSLEATRLRLNSRMSISSDRKSGFITIEGDDRDAQFSAQLVNEHVAALRELLTRLAVTDAQQRRIFFEQQVAKSKKSLTDAENQFRKTQAASGLVVTQALAEAGVKESAQLRGQIAAREVQLQSISRFVTDEHPEVQRISAELYALRRQLAEIEQGSGKSAAGNIHGMQAVQAFRDMKVQEALLENLIKQLELARADEAKEGPLLQQVDMAIPPEKPIKPKRLTVVLLGFLLSIVTALVVIYLRQSNWSEMDAWKRIRKAWVGR